MREKAHQTITEAHQELPPYKSMPRGPELALHIHREVSRGGETSTQRLWGHGGGRRQRRVTQVPCICNLDSSTGYFSPLPHLMVGPGEVCRWPSRREALGINITEEPTRRQTWLRFSTGHTHETGTWTSVLWTVAQGANTMDEQQLLSHIGSAHNFPKAC